MEHQTSRLARKQAGVCSVVVGRDDVRVERSEVGVGCWGSVWRWPAADSLCYIKSTSGGGGRGVVAGGVVRSGEGAGLRSVRVGVAVGVGEQRLRKERVEFGRD
jgi:hypothetical protein